VKGQPLSCAPMHVFIWCHNMFSITAQAGHRDSLKLLTTLLR